MSLDKKMQLCIKNCEVCKKYFFKEKKIFFYLISYIGESPIIVKIDIEGYECKVDIYECIIPIDFTVYPRSFAPFT